MVNLMIRLSETTQCGGRMAHLATSLTALVVRVSFVKRVHGLISLEMFLKELEASLPCDVREVHGKRERCVETWGYCSICRMTVFLWLLRSQVLHLQAHCNQLRADSEPKSRVLRIIRHVCCQARPAESSMIELRNKVTIGNTRRD